MIGTFRGRVRDRYRGRNIRSKKPITIAFPNPTPMD